MPPTLLPLPGSFLAGIGPSAFRLPSSLATCVASAGTITRQLRRVGRDYATSMLTLQRTGEAPMKQSAVAGSVEPAEAAAGGLRVREEPDAPVREHLAPGARLREDVASVSYQDLPAL